MKMYLAYYARPRFLLKMCLTYYAHPWFYEDVPHKLCTSSVFMKMYLTNYAHPGFFWRCASQIVHMLGLWRCASQIMHILGFYEDVPHKLCTSLLFMKMCRRNYAHTRFLWGCASHITGKNRKFPLCRKNNGVIVEFYWKKSGKENSTKCHFSIILPHSGKFPFCGIIMEQNNGISAQNISSKIQTTWNFNFSITWKFDGIVEICFSITWNWIIPLQGIKSFGEMEWGSCITTNYMIPLN